MFFELTSYCNLKCMHCGNSCPSGKYQGMIESKYIYRTIDEIIEHRSPYEMMFCITGGEPLLREDWQEICSYIAQKGYSWGMTSNGTLIDEKMIQKLSDAGMKTISISLDGLENTHEKFRGVKGCFEKTINAIRLLAQSNLFVEVGITTVVHNENIDELEELYQLVKSLGAVSWKITEMEPIGEANNNTELFLSDKQYFSMLDFIAEKRNKQELEVTYGCSHFLPEQYEGKVRGNPFLCGAGIFIASIAANGDVLPCLDIEYRDKVRQGNITTDSFWKVWSDEFKIFRDDNHAVDSAVCGNCEMLNVCQGDSWHTWDFDNNRPKVCRMYGG